MDGRRMSLGDSLERTARREAAPPVPLLRVNALPASRRVWEAKIKHAKGSALHRPGQTLQNIGVPYTVCKNNSRRH